MIKSNELREGNCVSCLGAIMQLDRHDLSDLFNPSIDMYEMDLEPIELTEEILLKCGFEHCSNRKVYQLYLANDYQIFVGFDFQGEFKLQYRVLNIILHEIKYLHQLQNLYFALTGKELEINL